MKGNVFIILLGLVFMSALPPLAPAQQCSYLQLIMSNPNHPNGIRCWPPNCQIGYCYSFIDEPFSSANMEVGDAASSWGAPSGYCIKMVLIR